MFTRFIYNCSLWVYTFYVTPRDASDSSRSCFWYNSIISPHIIILVHLKFQKFKAHLSNCAWFLHLKAILAPLSNFLLSFFRDVINLETTEPLNDVYFNFNIWTNPTVRRPIKKKLLRSGYQKTPFAEYPEYYRVLANHTFVISPPGNQEALRGVMGLKTFTVYNSMVGSIGQGTFLNSMAPG